MLLLIVPGVGMGASDSAAGVTAISALALVGTGS